MHLARNSRSPFLLGSVKISKLQRKKPQQGRSKAIVNALAEAGTRVFTATGFEGATTNAIAELAGVSIGSLYQYFPDKLALLSALHERHVIGLWRTAGAACLEACSLPWPEAPHHFVNATVEYNLKSGQLFGIFQKELPARTPSGLEIDAAKVIYEDHLRRFLLAHKSNIRVNIDRAIQMIPIIGKGVVTTTFHSQPEFCRNGQLIDELTKVLNVYLSACDIDRDQNETRDA